MTNPAARPPPESAVSLEIVAHLDCSWGRSVGSSAIHETEHRENIWGSRRVVCNLFSNTLPPDAMRQLFGVKRDQTGNQPPLPGVFPRHTAPVVRLADDGKRELTPMHWGFLMPQVSKRTGKPILPKAVNNARDDKVRSSPFWRSSFEERRCLIRAWHILALWVRLR